jgi:thiosulfate dehydrogenase [quinone] large subunit
VDAASRTNPRGVRPESPPSWLAGRQWAQYGLRQPGWLLLPLRAFLGVTFLYASLQKLANPTYLSASNPQSVVGQMQSLRHASPLGPLLGLSLHAPTAVGLMIAFGELAVAVGVLLGLCTRLAAVGGMALSLTFLLTVSWRTTPYYYGSDIVFFFAWSVIAGFGAGDVLCLDSWLEHRARKRGGTAPVPVTVTLNAPRLREICPRKDMCGLRTSGECGRQRCPVFAPEAGVAAAADATSTARRHLVTRAVFLTGAGALLLGGATAWLGRLVGGTKTHLTAGHVRRTPPSTRATPVQHASGTAIGPASALPVGQAAQFTDPATGSPAYLVHPAGSTFVAFSAVCTHAGCTVQYDASSVQFVCPCHGGTYDARSGHVLGGPPPSALAPIAVQVVDGQVRVG